jgi:polysaccharide pyruvyl transferase CsaB
MRVLVSGYYGFGNLGDEAILAALAQELAAAVPDIEIEVLSSDLDHTHRVHGLDAAQRWKLPSIWRALRRSDYLLQGGGGLIQDATSTASPAYYLGVLALARLARRPYAIFLQGLGPLSRPIWQKWTARMFRRARLVVLRDARSADLLRQWGCPGPISVAADPVVLLRPAPRDELDAWLADQHAPALDSPYRVLVPRQVGEHEPALTAAARALASGGRRVLVVPFQRQDEEMAARIAAAAGATPLPAPEDPRVAMALVADSAGVLSVRLHALVFAAAAGVPALAVAYDPKVAAFCDAVGYGYATDLTAGLLDRWIADAQGGAGRPAPDKVAALQNHARQAFVQLANALSGRADSQRGPAL